MKLSKYPSLVQNEILENMTYSELFLLSFVSKNTKILIKSSQTTRLRSIGRIVYYNGGTRDGMANISVKPIFHHSSRVEKANEFILKMVECKEDAKNNDSFQLNVAGELIDFGICGRYNCPVTSFLSMDKESVIESIHNCLLNFFDDSIEYYWVVSDYKLFIPRLQNLSVCLSIGNMVDIADRFPSSPVLNHIENSFPMNRPFRPESMFYQADSLLLILNVKSLLAVLEHFQGRQASLTCTNSFDIRGLTKFVNRWKSGEAFQNLEYLKVRILPTTEIPWTEMLNAIGVKRIDETKTPPTHTLPRVRELMKLSKYPNVVQKEIFSNMETSTLFLFSFVSKKMKNNIKSNQTKRFKSIKRIMCEFDDTGEIYIPPIYNHDYIMNTFEELSDRDEDDKRDLFQLNVSGRIIDFILPKHHDVPVPIAIFHIKDKESVMESIYKYCLDFFGAHMFYSYVSFWETREGKSIRTPNFDTIFNQSFSD
ncbi:unnamed protein product [Caenorhabditis nigoni]